MEDLYKEESSLRETPLSRLQLLKEAIEADGKMTKPIRFCIQEIEQTLGSEDKTSLPYLFDDLEEFLDLTYF